MMSQELIDHLQSSTYNLVRHENCGKLVELVEEIHDTIKFIAQDEESLSRTYYSSNDWMVDYVTLKMPVHKLWNLSLIADAAFYLRYIEISKGNGSSFWELVEENCKN